VVFKTEESKTGDQKLEIRSWRSETEDQKLEIGNWRSKTGDTRWRDAVNVFIVCLFTACCQHWLAAIVLPYKAFMPVIAIMDTTFITGLFAEVAFVGGK